MEIEARIFRALAFPQAHRVIVKRFGIVRLELGKSAEALNHFIGLTGRTIVGSREKKITTLIGRVQIRRTDQRFDGVVIIAVCVERHSQTDRQTRRIWITLDGILENFDGRPERAMDQQFAAPIEQVALARIGVRGKFVLVGGFDEFPVLLFHRAKQVVQLGCVLLS